MADIQSQSPGAMAAVIGLDRVAVEQLCESVAESGAVAPANINSPAQIVVSGDEAAVARLVEAAPDAGATKAVRLQVGAAFHSRMMVPVQQELAAEMRSIAWSDPRVPMASNAGGGLATTAEQVRKALIDQIASPVLWVDCVRVLVAEGCGTFLELGPGRVLGGLVRQIAPEIRVFAADSPAKLSEFAEAQNE